MCTGRESAPQHARRAINPTAPMTVGSADLPPATSEPPAPAPSPARSRALDRERILTIALRLIRFGPGVILVSLFITMAILSPYFLTGQNMQNLGTQSSIVAALAVGQLLVIIARGLDVSVSAVLAFSAVLPASIFGASNGGLFLLLAIATGVAVGTVNAMLIVVGRIPQPLIVTVATLGIVQGVSLLVSGGGQIVGLPPVLSTIGNNHVGPVPVAVVLVLVLAALAYVFLSRTRWGRWIYATGGNPEAAGRLGIPVNRIMVSVYILCAVSASVAGILFAAQTDAAVPTAGTTYLLDAITAVVIGGASLFGGRGTVLGALIGALILGTIRNGLALLNVEPFWQTVAVGCIVLVALEMDVLRGQIENRLRVSQATTGR
jgi:ribose transport system permease protein